MNKVIGAFLLAVACTLLGAFCEVMRSMGVSLISGGM